MTGEQPPSGNKKEPQGKLFIMPTPGSARTTSIKKGNQRVLEFEKRKEKRRPIRPYEDTYDLLCEAQQLEKTDPEQALKIYQGILEIEKNSHLVFIALINMGFIYFEKEKLKEAEEYWERALKIDPDDPLANSNMGSLKVEQKRNEEALIYLTKALKKDAQNPDSHFNLARTYKNLGYYQAAIKHYQIYINITLNNQSEEESRKTAETEIEKCKKRLLELEKLKD